MGKTDFDIDSKAIAWDRMPDTGLLVVTGHRGEGKTALAWWLADQIAERSGKNVASLGIPEMAQKNMPKHIRHLGVVEDINFLSPSIIVIDESSIVASNRRAMSKENRKWLELVRVIRHKGHLLIFINQHSRGTDFQIMMDADYVLMKRPTLLHIRFTKREFRKEVQFAFDSFNEIPDDRTKQHVFVVDYKWGRARMLDANMPRWWSDEISKSYATFAIGQSG